MESEQAVVLCGLIRSHGTVRFFLAMIGLTRIRGSLAGCLLLMLSASGAFAQKQAEPPSGDIQIFRNALQTVFVFPRVGPVDREGELVAAGDSTGQVRQALENLRLMASRVGVSPAHFVTLTLYVKEKSAGDGLEKIARESFSDWSPSTTLVETKDLRVASALVEVEGVAIVRPPKAGR